MDTNNDTFVEKYTSKYEFNRTLLLTNEQDLIFGPNPPSAIGTITWIVHSSSTSTSSSSSLDHLSCILEQRLVQLCVCNPWLLGRIITKDKKGYLAHPSKLSPQDDKDFILGNLFVQHDTPIDGLYYTDTTTDISRSYSKLTSLLSKTRCLLLHKHDLIDEPIFKVVIVPCSNNSSSTTSTKFAIIVSMSHLIADGYTYYTIYNYLMNGGRTSSTGNGRDQTSPPPTLQVERIHEFVSLRDELIGKEESFLFSKPGFIASLILGFLYDFNSSMYKSFQEKGTTLLNLLMWKATPEEKKEEEESTISTSCSSGSGDNEDMICFMIDQDKMNQFKKDVIVAENTSTTAEQPHGDATSTTSRVDFVSSNDVLTNWLFQYSICTQGLMAINLRNRLLGNKITNVHAGNYDTTIYYRVPQDTCNTPTLIRQSLLSNNNFHRVHTYDQKPTFYELASSNFSLITNWSSFTNANVDMNMDGTQQNPYEYELLLHMPVLDITSSNKMPSTLAVCVIFRPKPNQLGLMIFGDEEKRLQDIISAGGGGKNEHASPFLVQS